MRTERSQFGGAFTGTFSGPGTLRWQSVAGVAQAAAGNVGYVLGNDALVTVTLPAAPNIGDVVRVLGLGSGCVIAHNDGQQIRVDATTSTAGAGGGASGGQWTALELVHAGGGVFVAASHQGTITLQ